MIFTNSIDPILFAAGPLEVRWYGALFAIGLLLNYLLLRWVFGKEKFNVADLDSLVLYLFVGLVVGARLGHVFFYNAEYFLSDPIKILQIWNGGLASHGAAIGVLLAYLIWTWKHKVKFTKYADYLVLGMPISAGFVRLGNYFNSEIVGKATDGSWGVVSQRLGESFPRHPSQFYEAGLSFTIFAVLIFVYLKWKNRPPLFLMFLYMGLYFATRFLVEFFKKRHTISADFPLSMGQMLSILPVLIAIIYLVFYYSKQRKAK